MSPLDSEFQRARRLWNVSRTTAYVGKRRGDWQWSICAAPKPDWQGFYYSVHEDQIRRHGYGGSERMR